MLLNYIFAALRLRSARMASARWFDAHGATVKIQNGPSLSRDACELMVTKAQAELARSEPVCGIESRTPVRVNGRHVTAPCDRSSKMLFGDIVPLDCSLDLSIVRERARPFDWLGARNDLTASTQTRAGLGVSLDAPARQGARLFLTLWS